jgi:hypothetical protein
MTAVLKGCLGGKAMVVDVMAGLIISGALLPVTNAVASPASRVEAPTSVPTSELIDEAAVEPIEDVTEITEEIPEEILRTEIITEARSPLTGEPLNAAEYAQLQAELASPAGGNLVSEDLRYLVFLLQLRHAVRPILPFIK